MAYNKSGTSLPNQLPLRLISLAHSHNKMQLKACGVALYLIASKCLCGLPYLGRFTPEANWHPLASSLWNPMYVHYALQHMKQALISYYTTYSLSNFGHGGSTCCTLNGFSQVAHEKHLISGKLAIPEKIRLL